MKILFLAPRFPLPALKGNQVRACQHLRWLAERHEVDLLCVAPRRPSDDDLAAVRRWTRRCEVVTPGVLDWATAAVRAATRDAPWQCSLYDHRALHDRIAAWKRESRYDLAHVQLIRLADALPALVDLPCVVDLVDALSFNFANRAAREPWPLRSLLNAESLRLRRAEEYVCTRADVATVVSARDARCVSSGRPPRAARLAVDLERFPFAEYENRAGIVFSGNLAYFPNRLAVETLLGETMPRVWAERPEERLVIAGANPRAAWTRRDGSGRVTTTGLVADLGAPLRAGAVAAFPMHAGSGMQLKILEACASGTPVVTTRLAAEAFSDLEPGVHALVADEPDEFVAGVSSLLADPTRAAAMARRAREWVETRYCLAAAGRDLEAAYAEAIARFEARASRR